MTACAASVHTIRVLGTTNYLMVCSFSQGRFIFGTEDSLDSEGSRALI